MKYRNHTKIFFNNNSNTVSKLKRTIFICKVPFACIHGDLKANNNYEFDNAPEVVLKIKTCCNKGNIV